jgi:sortase A
VKRGARVLAALALGLAALAGWQLAAAAWIHAKAALAQQLIASAWEVARDGGPARRPWPWADMRPVARLAVPARNVRLYVLDSATPRALAFGPAHVGGTASPGMPGNSVLVAHRDTHFAFLRDIAAGETIEVESANGRITRYRVRETAVVHDSDARVLEAGDAARLTLITCFPFDAVRPGTRLRYVVVAERDA